MIILSNDCDGRNGARVHTPCSLQADGLHELTHQCAYGTIAPQFAASI
ncbi:MAG: hypothetical protein M0R49_08985 [Limnochordia bacterium]|nr:hypothetical protein [Limnochordia bacterium]